MLTSCQANLTYCTIYTPVKFVSTGGIEESMISIYSAISQVCLAGGKHYKMNTGKCYTIVNDLAM
jgi:2-keto-3-deoxy-6-phosphogluconate aldolase